MDGYRCKRTPPAHLRRLALEPLEDRFLLAALPGLVGPFVVSSTPVPTTATTSARIDSSTLLGPSLASNPSSVPHANTLALPARIPVRSPAQAANTYPGSPPAGNAESGRDGWDGGEYAASNYVRSADADSVARGRDRDNDSDGDGDDDAGDDDRDEYGRAADETEVRAAEGQTTNEADYRADSPLVAAGAGMPGPVAEGPEEASLPPVPVPAVTGPPPAEKAFPALLDSDGLWALNAPVAPVANEPPANERPRVPVAGPASWWRPVEVIPAVDHLLAVGIPSAGAISLDAALIERGVEAFFSSLSAEHRVGVGGWLSVGTASWLVAVAAAALEISRLRDKAYRSLPVPDGTPEPTA